MPVLLSSGHAATTHAPSAKPPDCQKQCQVGVKTPPGSALRGQRINAVEIRQTLQCTLGLGASEFLLAELDLTRKVRHTARATYYVVFRDQLGAQVNSLTDYSQSMPSAT